VKRKGFSLIELMIVVGVMAVLALGIYIFAGGSIDKSRVAKTESVITKLRAAINNYYSDTGYYPSKAKQLWKNDAGAPNWSGPYVQPPRGNANLNGFYNMPWGGSGQIACSNGKYVALVMYGMNKGLCQKLDKAIDDNNLSSGLVRWNSNSNYCVYYFELNNPGVSCK